MRLAPSLLAASSPTLFVLTEIFNRHLPDGEDSLYH